MHNDDWQRQRLALPKNRFVCAEQWPRAAMRIHARHFSFIFLAFFMLTSMSVDVLHLYKAPHLEEATFRVHQRGFLRLKRKLFVSRRECLWTKHGYLCYYLPAKFDIIVHMDVKPNSGPTSSSSRSTRKRPYRGWRSGRTIRAREASTVCNIQHAMTPRRHQFAFQSRCNDNNLVIRIPLISSWPCCRPPLRFCVWNARSVKTKVSLLCDRNLSHRLATFYL